MNKTYHSLSEFYPYYLSEHRNPICRGLHYTGSLLTIFLLLYALVTQQYYYFVLLPFIGYGFAWVGHFVFEHNKPATFQYPGYSFVCDWIMLKDFLTGQLPAKMANI